MSSNASILNDPWEVLESGLGTWVFTSSISNFIGKTGFALSKTCSDCHHMRLDLTKKVSL